MNKSQKNQFESLAQVYEEEKEIIEAIVNEIVDMGEEAANGKEVTEETHARYAELSEEYSVALPDCQAAAVALAEFGNELAGEYADRSDKWQESDKGSDLIQFAEELSGVEVADEVLPEEFDIEHARIFCIDCSEVQASPI